MFDAHLYNENGRLVGSFSASTIGQVAGQAIDHSIEKFSREKLTLIDVYNEFGEIEAEYKI